MNPNLTDLFLDHLYALSRDPLPPEVREQARLCLLDYRGAVAAGLEMRRKQNDCFLAAVAAQSGNCRAEGLDTPVSLQNAAFLNAMNAHAAEVDDGQRQAQIHLGASIISALLPMAQIEALPEDSILVGVVVGYEAAILAGRAMNPAHRQRGYHTSGTCGTIGVAMAVSAALSFNRERMKTALAAATGSAAGLLELQEDGSELKPYNLAQAAVGGLTAAYCAKAGYVGPADPVGGPRGLLSVLTENPKTEFLSRFESGKYQIMTIYRKPYAACRHAHSAIEAALAIRAEYGLDPDRIWSVRVDTYGMAIKGHDHKVLPGVASAKMSIPFSVALALVRGCAGLDDYSEDTIRDKRVLSLMEKVCLSEDPEITSWLPNRRAARVTVCTEEDVFSRLVEYPKGEPENPMTEQEIIMKYEHARL